MNDIQVIILYRILRIHDFAISYTYTNLKSLYTVTQNVEIDDKYR